MGAGASRSTAADASTTIAATLTIRNLTITPLELKLAEHHNAAHHLSKPAALVKVSSRISGRRRSHERDASPAPSLAASTRQEEPQTPSTTREIKDLTIQPFSEHITTISPPDPTHHEQLRLTFEDPSTGHRYSADIPGPSPRSIVLKPSSPKPEEEETKEFTAIYLPTHNYLALFSSANLSSWMSTLDPSLPLTALSIPGTHNSPTHYVALPSVRCQAVPITTQLANGVRFLDVRVSCPRFPTTTTSPKPPLALVHAAFPVSLTGTHHLSTLLQTLHTFLTTHPSETILLSLKREGTGLGTDADLHRILTTFYITDPQQWYTSPEIPTLAQARGRIVLVRRFKLHPSTGASTGTLGIDASVWPDNVADGTCGSGLVRIQDYYGVGKPGDIRLKVRFAQEGLERAAERVHVPASVSAPELGPGPKLDGVVRAAGEGEAQRACVPSLVAGETISGEVENGAGSDTGALTLPSPFFINFLSASNLFNSSCWPEKIAVKINPSMIEYLCMGHGAPGKGPGKLTIGDAATGIVVTDWVGHHGDWDLIRCIVGWNARLQLRR